MKNPITEMAHRLIDLGVAPVVLQGKIPTKKAWQKTRYTHGDVDQLFTNGHNVGCACGEISGGLELLDFDAKGECFGPWCDEVRRRSPGLLGRLLQENTPSGGEHEWYRCPGLNIPGNNVLARKRVVVEGEGEFEYAGKTYKAELDGDEWIILPGLIETRGSGGQGAFWPSPGYRIAQMDGVPVLTLKVSDLTFPEITEAERKVLIDCALLFDEPRRSEAVASNKPSKKSSETDRPGDDFNDRAGQSKMLEMLETAGWKVFKWIGDTCYMTRPGKETDISAGLYASGVFHCFSSNASPFEEKKSYSPFAVHALLNHNGDYSKAAADLKRNGFGKDVGSNDAPEPPPADTCNLADLCRKILSSREAAGDFDMNRMPQVLRNYVRDICETTAADPVMILQSVLCAASAVLKKKVFIGEGTYFQELYPNLYTLTIANSGAFKSTGLRKGMRIAFDIDQQIDEQIDFQKAELIKDGIADGQREVIEVRIKNLERQKPLLPQKWTPESLLEDLGDGLGGVIMLSEFGEWLANLTKGHYADFKGLITDFFDSPPYYRYKTRHQGDYIVRNPFISINAVSTLRWVAQNIDQGDVESGFFARFLIFCPPRNPIIPPALPDRTLRPDHRSYVALKNAITSILEIREFYLDQDARSEFSKIHGFLFNEYQADDQSELLGPYIKRWGSTF